METISTHIPTITLGGLTLVVGLLGVLWRSIRNVVTKDDMSEQIDTLRAETKEERDILHDRINKLKEDYQRADQQQTNELTNQINTLDRHLNSRLDSIDRHVSQIVEVMLKNDH